VVLGILESLGFLLNLEKILKKKSRKDEYYSSSHYIIMKYKTNKRLNF
jgi:hypothetical protein